MNVMAVQQRPSTTFGMNTQMGKLGSKTKRDADMIARELATVESPFTAVISGENFLTVALRSAGRILREFDYDARKGVAAIIKKINQSRSLAS